MGNKWFSMACSWDLMMVNDSEKWFIIVNTGSIMINTGDYWLLVEFPSGAIPYGYCGSIIYKWVHLHTHVKLPESTLWACMMFKYEPGITFTKPSWAIRLCLKTWSIHVHSMFFCECLHQPGKNIWLPSLSRGKFLHHMEVSWVIGVPPVIIHF